MKTDSDGKAGEFIVRTICKGQIGKLKTNKKPLVLEAV